MTQKEFLKRLSKTKGWKLDNFGRIRRDGNWNHHISFWNHHVSLLPIDNECPISALGNRAAYDWDIVADKLGLGDKTAKTIVRAADCVGHPFRSKLLRATGLK
jgi:hypothetical protein